MTRDKLIERVSFAIAAFFGESDHPDDAARAALAEIYAAGFVIVPREPTEEQIRSGHVAADDLDGPSEVIGREQAASVYAAMIDASPFATARDIP